MAPSTQMQVFCDRNLVSVAKRIKALQILRFLRFYPRRFLDMCMHQSSHVWYEAY
jgi:hypothetical protein